jgi:hypothetical protein
VIGRRRAVDLQALALATALDAVLVDTSGRLVAAADGRGPDGRDVLAGRATVVESFRTFGGVPVVDGSGLEPVARPALVRAVAAETGLVIIR